MVGIPIFLMQTYGNCKFDQQKKKRPVRIKPDYLSNTGTIYATNI